MAFNLVKITGATITSVGTKGDTGATGATGPTATSNAGVFVVDMEGNLTPNTTQVFTDTYYSYDGNGDIVPL